MLRKIVFLIFFVSVFGPGTALQMKDTLELSGELTTSMGISYIKPKKQFSIDFPLYFQVGLFYDAAQIESAVSISFRRELDIGETYLKGGSDYSYLKIGYFIEEWGKGYSVNPLGIMNSRDDRYPSNIFFRKKYRPDPAMLFTFGKHDLYQQIVISNRAEDITSIKDTDIGVRGISIGENFDFSLGFVRKIGYPPTLIFISVEDIEEKQRVWLDLGFDYYRNRPPKWYSVLGFSREFPEADVRGEYVIDGFNTYFFIEEVMTVNELSLFDLKTFLRIPDFSSAFNASFIIEAGKDFIFEPGMYLFIGKKGKYFSPLRSDNHSEFYIKLSYSF
jgi:hypothetical protein